MKDRTSRGPQAEKLALMPHNFDSTQTQDQPTTYYYLGLGDICVGLRPHPMEAAAKEYKAQWIFIRVQYY